MTKRGLLPWAGSQAGEPGDPNACKRTSCSMHSKRLAAFPFGFLDDVSTGDFEVAIEVVGEGEASNSKPMVGTPCAWAFRKTKRLLSVVWKRQTDLLEPRQRARSKQGYVPSAQLILS